jgi:hypothetical protein
MDRAYTRYRRSVALARKRRMLRDNWGSWGFLDPEYFYGRPRHWQAEGFCGRMNTPCWWTHMHMIVPARRQEAARLHQIERGADPDAIIWPSHRKPHVYYW